jgi:hypothetical protein
MFFCQKQPLILFVFFYNFRSRISGYTPNNVAVGTANDHINNGQVVENGNLHHILDKEMIKPRRTVSFIMLRLW